VPAQPLIDFERLDLTQTVRDSAEVRRLCLQRNRLSMLDAVVHIGGLDGLVVGYKDVSPDDWWAPDHFPGRPIFPGALQIEGAAQLCAYHFLDSRPEMQHKLVGFGGVNDARFRGVVAPPARLYFAAKPLRLRSTMFTYQAQGFVDGKLVMEAEILGVILD
jgi:3-hydroxyacyl-[acyl-carrier-protein] dehydratase